MDFKILEMMEKLSTQSKFEILSNLGELLGHNIAPAKISPILENFKIN